MGYGNLAVCDGDKYPDWSVLAPVDEDLDCRSPVLLRLRRRRRTSPGAAPARWLWRGDSARRAAAAPGLILAGSIKSRSGARKTQAPKDVASHRSVSWFRLEIADHD